jgi:hypothetical protein
MLGGGALANASGQRYRGVIVPPAGAISRGALARLEAFARMGGTVVVMGPAPALVVERTFLEATGPADVSWALHEPGGTLTQRVLAALPAPDVRLQSKYPALKYTHRRLADADLYFLFNEADEAMACTAWLRGRGPTQAWNAWTGAMVPFEAATDGDAVRLTLELGPWSEVRVVGGSGAA